MSERQPLQQAAVSPRGGFGPPLGLGGAADTLPVSRGRCLKGKGAGWGRGCDTRSYSDPATFQAEGLRAFTVAVLLSPVCKTLHSSVPSALSPCGSVGLLSRDSGGAGALAAACALF